MESPRRTSIVAFALGLSFVFVACGGDASDSAADGGDADLASDESFEPDATVLSARTGRPACDRSPILIEDVRPWPALERRDVLVRDGLVAAIGAPGTVDAPTGARSIDGAGAILLPGLIDAHTHLDIWPAPRPTDVAEVPSADVAALQTLASGVTTVRNHLSDMVVVPDLVARSRDACSPMPRVITGSRGLMGGRPDLDGRLMWGARDATDARQKVRDAFGLGERWVALHGLTSFRDDVLEAIVDEADALGMRVMVEGAASDAARRGLDVGARSIDYLDQTGAAGYPEDLLTQWAGRDGAPYAVPPLGYYTRVQAYANDPTAVRRPERVRFMPPEFGAALLDAQEAHFRELAERGLPPFFEHLAAKFRQLRAAGVPMVVGSDSGSGGQFHADAIWVELRAWRDHGVSVEEALAAATVHAADMLGLADTGAISPGARADLVLYIGDLVAGELDLRYVDTVIKEGVVHLSGGRPTSP